MAANNYQRRARVHYLCELSGAAILAFMAVFVALSLTTPASQSPAETEQRSLSYQRDSSAKTA